MPMVQKDYTPMIQTEVAKYLRKLIESPEQFSTHSHAVATAIIMKVTYGYELEEDGDPLHKLVQETMDAFDDVTRPGVYLVDAFAWCSFQFSTSSRNIFNRNATQ
jgi:tRNA G10  N-methylase Trm11